MVKNQHRTSSVSVFVVWLFVLAWLLPADTPCELGGVWCDPKGHPKSRVIMFLGAHLEIVKATAISTCMLDI